MSFGCTVVLAILLGSDAPPSLAAERCLRADVCQAVKAVKSVILLLSLYVTPTRAPFCDSVWSSSLYLV
jgi:hypothetical protein